ncbi:MAG: helix-turn-helix transcriptional regulator [Deferribacterales bacterium]|nr:helix-turn-helix transcriptional regulator [Deferribacterales bacterium]
MNGFDINIGERVKKLRHEKGLTLQDVAKLTGFSKALISQIENNIVTPPISTLAKIARVLNVKMTYFFEEEIDYKDYYIVRANERKFAFREGAKHGYLYEELASMKYSDIFESFMVYIKPGSGEKKLFSHKGYEFMYIVSGHLRLYLNQDVCELKEGDTIAYNSEIPHYAESLIDGDSKVLSVRIKMPKIK